MGSFFIPMAVMIYVYVRISCVVASRHDHMTEIEVHKVIIKKKIIIQPQKIYMNEYCWFGNIILFLNYTLPFGVGKWGHLTFYAQTN